MTYFLVRHRDEVRFGCGPPNDYVLQNKTVETIEEAEEWAAENYNERQPLYAIRGEKIGFDFARTVTVIAKSKD